MVGLFTRYIQSNDNSVEKHPTNRYYLTVRRTLPAQRCDRGAVRRPALCRLKVLGSLWKQTSDVTSYVTHATEVDVAVSHASWIDAHLFLHQKSECFGTKALDFRMYHNAVCLFFGGAVRRWWRATLGDFWLAMYYRNSRPLEWKHIRIVACSNSRMFE